MVFIENQGVTNVYRVGRAACDHFPIAINPLLHGCLLYVCFNEFFNFENFVH